MNPIEVCGVTVDFAERSVTVAGRMLPATAVQHSPGNHEHERVVDEMATTIAELIYKDDPARAEAYLASPVKAMPTATHLTLVCENGWWVEVALYPSDEFNDFFPAHIAYGPGNCGADVTDTDDPLELLEFYNEVSCRSTYVPSQEDIESFSDTPWAGLKPGTWITTLADLEA